MWRNLSPNDGASDQDGRARLLLAWCAERYVLPGSAEQLTIPQPLRGVPDPQKYVWPKALARLSLDRNDRWAHAMIGQFHDRGGPPASHAASFYHFAAYGLAKLLFAYPDAVAPYRSAILRGAMREEQLFRGEGTENHIAMWRTSGYLFAQEAGDRRRRIEMGDWIARYSDRLLSIGQGEFDSGTYLAFDVSAWLNLWEYARDVDIRHRARSVVDFLAASLALRWRDGVQAGGEKRGCSLRNGDSIASFLGWLWWGGASSPPWTQSAIYSVFAALSHYRPAPATVALADKTSPETQGRYLGSKPNYAMERASETRETLFIAAGYSVGALYSPTGGWGGGETQETLWKFASAGGDVVSGAGAGYARKTGFSGEGRSPWDQIAHFDDLVFQMTRVPPNGEDITRKVAGLYEIWRRRSAKVRFAAPAHEPWAYVSLPSDADLRPHEGLLFVNCHDRAFAAIRPFGGAMVPVNEKTRGGRIAFRTDGAQGELLGFVYEFGDPVVDGSFPEFMKKVLSASRPDFERRSANEIAYRNRHGRALRAQFVTSGRWVAPEYDWGSPPDWPTGEGHGRVPRLWWDGREVRLDRVWPVYHGPFLRVLNGRLSLGPVAVSR
ncbi:MAG: hypothetical protein SFU56_12665 [Capsulimonadales bacterium]|nr:hypothetical protein [Capsulimonadales bacterium]